MDSGRNDEVATDPHISSEGRVFRRSAHALGTALGDGVAILHSGSNTYFSLDEVGATVWNAIEPGASLEDVVAAVCAEFEIDEQTCRADVAVLLEQLRTNDLVENS